MLLFKPINMAKEINLLFENDLKDNKKKDFFIIYRKYNDVNMLWMANYTYGLITYSHV